MIGKAATDCTDFSENRTAIRANMPWNLSLSFLFTAFLLTMTVVTVADPDLWGHLRFGLDILEKGSVRQVDPYSYLTKGSIWINHEWLAEVLLAMMWRICGSAGLILLKTSVALLTFGVIYRHLRRSSVPHLKSLIFLGILLEILMPFIAAARPYMFTALFFAIILIVVVRAEKGALKLLWLLPPIMALWANLHGGFLAGIGIVSLWACLHMIQTREAKKILPPVVMSWIAILINPYHLELLSFLARTAIVPRPEITDWQSIEWRSILGILYFALLAAACAGLAFTRKYRNPALVGLSLVIALLPFFAVRHVLLAAIGLIILAGEHMASAADRFLLHFDQEVPIRSWMPVFPAILAIVMIVGKWDAFRHITLVEGFYPVKAVELLKQSGVQGDMAAEFAWGEYAIWHLAPGIKVAVDGRRETVYPPDVYRKYLDFQFGVANWDALLLDYPTNIALIQPGSRTYTRMCGREDWHLVYEDPISAVFTNNSKISERIRGSLPRLSIPDRTEIFP